MSAFSGKLKALRQANDIAQYIMADYLGVQLRTYQRYESGSNMPNYEKLLKLARFFNVTTDYLLGNEE